MLFRSVTDPCIGYFPSGKNAGEQSENGDGHAIGKAHDRGGAHRLYPGNPQPYMDAKYGNSEYWFGGSSYYVNFNIQLAKRLSLIHISSTGTLQASVSMYCVAVAVTSSAVCRSYGWFRQ